MWVYGTHFDDFPRVYGGDDRGIIKKMKINKKLNIKTFAILTGENPMGHRLTSEENIALNDSFASDLQRQHFRYFPITGSYNGNPEKPFMVFNIGLEDAKFLAHEYDQESFIFAEVLDKGHVIFKYYEKKFSEKEMKAKIAKKI